MRYFVIFRYVDGSMDDFWSNREGWVDRGQATVFLEREVTQLSLPTGGKWLEIGTNEAEALLKMKIGYV